jgi:hypothetical protein
MTRVERLTRIRDNLLVVIDEQTAAWMAAGSPPSFSVDGESYQWNEWLTSRLAAVEKLDELIQRASPFYVRTRMRG